MGIYGVGFLIAALASCLSFLRLRPAAILASLVTVTAAALLVLQATGGIGGNLASAHARVFVAGVQMEFPSEAEVLSGLNELIKKFPEAELLVLSEYTFLGPVPASVNAWCRENRRYLIVGAKDPAPNSDFYDTAFVIGPSGEIAFRQGKSVPVQFLKDGLPAKEQKLWDSPWGKIGLCICYDLSYTRVTDRLVQLGAQTIINPTMDVADWGRRQHELHARVVPVRAAEYGVPIFRIASSGISQWVNGSGKLLGSAPFPGQHTVLAGTMEIGEPGRLPADRRLAPVCLGITGLTVAGLMLGPLRSRFMRRTKP
jgi:apolipoprotein N-acyltransferase